MILDIPLLSPIASAILEIYPPALERTTTCGEVLDKRRLLS